VELRRNQSERKAVVLTADKFEDMEVFVPVFRLLEEGWQVDIAAPDMNEMSGENGYVLKPDKTIDDVDPDDYQLLIVPGGFPDAAPATVRKIRKAQDITKSFFVKDKPVASICHGPWTLVSAGVLKGRRLTSYWHEPSVVEGSASVCTLPVGSPHPADTAVIATKQRNANSCGRQTRIIPSSIGVGGGV